MIEVEDRGSMIEVEAFLKICSTLVPFVTFLNK